MKFFGGESVELYTAPSEKGAVEKKKLMIGVADWRLSGGRPK